MATHDGPGGEPAGEPAPPAGEPARLPARTGELQFTITRLGRPSRRRQLRRGAGAVLAAAALAAGSAALLARPAAHVTRRAALPRSPAVSIPRARGSAPPPSPSAAPPPPAAAPRSGHRVRAPAATTQVAGIGCPGGLSASVILDAAPTGPAWTAGGGGWTGNGCNGGSAWTMQTPGSRAAPSSLTWSFHPGAGASHCTLAVFVPTQNALGLGEYAISTAAGTLATAAVFQPDRAGQWVPLGTYPVAGGTLDIRFMPATATLTAAGPPGRPPAGPPRAGPPGPGHNSAVAASAALATCS